MPARELAAKRYAQAAFDLAKSMGTVDQWADDLGLTAVVMGDPEINGLLGSTRMPQPAKHRLLEQTLIGVSPLALNFANLLVSKGRSEIIGHVLEEYQRLLEEEKGIAHAVVTTAVPLSDEDRAAVTQKLSDITGQQVSVNTKVNPDIIGGLVARIGDTLIDGSVRSRLESLRRNLVSG